MIAAAAAWLALLPAQASFGAYAADLRFAWCVEDSVGGFAAHGRLDRVLCRRDARLVRRLGCGTYECRQEAEELLAALGDAALPALYWGTRCRDAEVVARAQRLLWRLGRCRRCDGSGEVDTPYDELTHTSYRAWCPACFGRRSGLASLPGR